MYQPTLSLGIILTTLLALFAATPAFAQQPLLNTFDDSGMLRTVTIDGGPIDETNPFFQSLGTNGRTCASCHVPSSAWGLTPSELQTRFIQTNGLDPVFSTNDGANSPDADVSTLNARLAAYSMLLSRGVFRIGLPIPPNAEFDLTAVDDPYGYASADELSLFRRPLPATNVRFLSDVMWDGRASFSPMKNPITNPTELFDDLMQQADNETVTHAQGAPLSQAQLTAIVNFELNLATAQQLDANAGYLSAKGALGGPANLAQQVFYVGINDIFGDLQTGAPFDPRVMTLFDAWSGTSDPAWATIARGAELFNSRTFDITGVGGINDNPKFGNPAVVHGTCSTCHNAPNVGSHSVPLALNIGVSAASRRTPDMPLYTFQASAIGVANGDAVAGQTLQTTDPGRALLTGKWIDLNKFKVPVLRGLAARPPYFHNGSAQDLSEVVDFYNARFLIGFTDDEKADLIAFLTAL